MKMGPFVVAGYFRIAVVVGFESKMEPFVVAGFFPIAVVVGSELKIEALTVAKILSNCGCGWL